MGAKMKSVHGGCMMDMRWCGKRKVWTSPECKVCGENEYWPSEKECPLSIHIRNSNIPLIATWTRYDSRPIAVPRNKK